MTKEEVKDVKSMREKHFCPICNTELGVSARYPDYICRACVSKATDKEGRPLVFYNETIMGSGFQAIFSDTQEIHDSHTCYIDGIECYAEEAYFGGIVVVPMKYKRRNG